MANLGEDIRNNVDIVDVVGKYVSLQRSGANYKGLCPFHQEKTPSFVVSPHKQICKCFGCGGGGDVISFIEQIENVDFLDAVKILSRDAGIDLSSYEKISFDKKSEWDKDKIKRINKLVQHYFSKILWQDQDAKHYVQEKRKLSDEIIKKFQLGFAPDSYYSVLQFLKQQWFSETDMLQASLARKWHQGGEYYDFFRGRLMFPIWDHMSNVIGFGARAMSDDQKPKYLNTTDTLIYDKSNVLYGINFLKTWVREHDFAIVVEWYMDVIALSGLGFDNAVATCGTSLTEGHLKILKRYTDHVYLLFDNDDAWFAASMRALKIAYKVGVYPKVLLLSHDYKDVDEMIQSCHWKVDAQEIFESLLKSQMDGFTFVVEQLQGQYDMSFPVDKKKVVNELFLLIAYMNNVTLQQHYMDVLAEKIHMTPEVLMSQFKQFRRKQHKVLLKELVWDTSPREFRPPGNMLLASLLWKNFLRDKLGFDRGVVLLELLDLVVRDSDEDDIIKQVWTNTLEESDIQRDLDELQLRWENELEKISRSDAFIFVLRTIQSPLQVIVQSVLKKQSNDHEHKKNILIKRQELLR